MVDIAQKGGREDRELVPPDLTGDGHQKFLFPQTQWTAVGSHFLSHNLRPQFLEKNECDVIVGGDPLQDIR